MFVQKKLVSYCFAKKPSPFHRHKIWRSFKFNGDIQLYTTTMIMMTQSTRRWQMLWDKFARETFNKITFKGFILNSGSHSSIICTSRVTQAIYVHIGHITKTLKWSCHFKDKDLCNHTTQQLRNAVEQTKPKVVILDQMARTPTPEIVWDLSNLSTAPKKSGSQKKSLQLVEGSQLWPEFVLQAPF